MTGDYREIVDKRLAKCPLGGIEEIAARLALNRLGVHGVRVSQYEDEKGNVNPYCGTWALFPKQAESESDWEARSIRMHAHQCKIVLAPKPESSPFERAEREGLTDHAPRRARVRGAVAAPGPGSPNAKPDSLPEHHRSGHGTVGLNVVRV